MKFKTAYDSSMPRVQFETTGPSLTRQASKAECDVNRIMDRFEKTGILEHRNTFQGSYGDYTDVPQDYHEAVNQVIEANEMFMTLPAKTRKRFGNDPAEFVDFVSDPDNKDEMARLGLTKALTAPDPIQEVIDRQDPAKAAPKAAPKTSEAPSDK